MTTIFLGMGLLLLTLAGFSLFSMKAPKGSAAMSGLANAAVATFLVEAVHRYISGDSVRLCVSRRGRLLYPEAWAESLPLS